MSSFFWPDGASAAVCLTFDVDGECGYLGAGGYEHRLSSLSEGRYGVVRGVPRILDLLARHGARGTFFVPGDTAAKWPGMVAEVLAAGHEVAHHSHMHLRSDRVTAAEQREEIERALDALAAAGAPRPVGYRSPSWELTPETFALLVEHGFAYDSSCMGDDRPYLEHHDGLEILELPVHWSLDDFPRFGYGLDDGGNQAAPSDLHASWLVEFQSAVAERRSVVYTMHPEVIGRPQRFAALERLFTDIQEDGRGWLARMDEVAAAARPQLAG